MALARSAEDRILFGVCGGVAQLLGIAPLWVRLAFLVGALASGVGLALYVVLSFVMLPPGYDVGSLIARLRHNADGLVREFFSLGEVFSQLWWEWRASFTHEDALVRWRVRVGGSVFVAGVLALLYSFGLFWWLTGWRVLALCLILVGVGFLGGRSHTESSPEREVG